MAATREDFLRELDQQRAQFRRTLEGKIAGMEVLWNAIGEEAAQAGGLERLERNAHGLAGSGAMFGFEDLGAQARTLEGLVHSARAATPPIGEGDRRAMASALAALRRCL